MKWIAFSGAILNKKPEAELVEKLLQQLHYRRSKLVGVGKMMEQ